MIPSESADRPLAGAGESVSASPLLAIAAVFAVGSIGAMLSGIKPVLVTAYASTLHFKAAGAGLLVGLEMGAFALGNALVSWRLYAARRTLVAVAALVTLAVGNVLAAHATALPTMGVARAIAGLGGGLAAGLMAAALANMPATERRFGQYMVTALVVAGAISWFAGTMLRSFGVTMMFLALAIVALLPIPLARHYPPMRRVALAPGAAHGGPPRMAIAALLLVAGTATYSVAAGGTWAFAGQLGIERGLDGAGVGQFLGIALLCGAAGACVPLVLRDRAGFVLPLVVAATISVVCIGALATSSATSTYGLALGGYMFAWVASFPYLMALCARFDPKGRLGALCFGVQNAAAGAGPFLAGLVLDQSGTRHLLTLASFGILGGTALLLSAVPFRPRTAGALQRGT